MSDDPDLVVFAKLNALAEETALSYRGLNLFEILRNDIGQKLARKSRYEQDPANFDPAYEFHERFREASRRLPKELVGDFKKVCLGGRARRTVAGSTAKKIYFDQSTRLKRLADSFGSRPDVLALSNKRNFTGTAVWAPVLSSSDLVASRRLVADYVDRVKKALDAQAVALLDEDLARLPADIARGLFSVNQAFRCLDSYPLDLVVVGGDNFLPPLALVLAARQRTIPTLCLQHGLDCERFFHEQVYSDYFCTWGEARAERCRVNSNHQPRAIYVTGCPEFDHLRFEEPENCPREAWLWLTRPHAPDKCCEPSRSPDEGARIFAALLAAMADWPAAQLVVKAHPRDDVAPYRASAARAGMAGRVRFAEGRGGVMDLIREAGLVFSEDSTSGLEALFCGKPLVHTHFSPAPPVLPLVDYGAALPGFGPEQIRSSVRELMADEGGIHPGLRPGQARFIEDFAGPLDGRALARVTGVVETILQSGAGGR